VMAFVRRVLLHFELIKKDEDFLRDYPEHCATLAEWLRTGTVTAEDVAGMRREDATNFAFDHVFVDEGQDWPRDEIAILGAIFPPERLVVADGVDQFVRGDAADWRAGVDPALLRIRRLRRCLRMKANLATFANAFAREIGLADWSVEPNPEAGGGDIIVVEGDYFRDWSVHERLVAEARAAGNAAVDLLCCVPPSLGSGGGVTSRRRRPPRSSASGVSPSGTAPCATSARTFRVRSSNCASCSTIPAVGWKAGPCLRCALTICGSTSASRHSVKVLAAIC